MDIEKELVSALQSDLISKKSLLDKLNPLYKQKKLIVPDNLAEGFVQVESLIKWEPSAFKGMTFGDVFNSIIDVDNDCEQVHGEDGLMWFAFSQDWWNSPYKTGE